MFAHGVVQRVEGEHSGGQAILGHVRKLDAAEGNKRRQRIRGPIVQQHHRRVRREREHVEICRPAHVKDHFALGDDAQAVGDKRRLRIAAIG